MDTFKVAEREPSAAGLNDTAIWHACPAARVALTHVELEVLKSPGFAPPKVEPETIRADVPEFVTITT